MITLAPPVPTLSTPAPEPPPKAYRAHYSWGYAGADGEGQGTLSLLLDPGTGRLILELHGLGERLLLLTGDRTQGYHLQIPRRNVDTRASSLKELPLPFLPSLGDVEALHRLLTQGQGPGVQARRFDASGPRNLRYQGRDDRGNEVLIWLTRKQWETLPTPEAQPRP